LAELSLTQEPLDPRLIAIGALGIYEQGEAVSNDSW